MVEWMFELPAFFASQHVRSEAAQLFSEGVATFGLLLIIVAVAHSVELAHAFARLGNDGPRKLGIRRGRESDDH